MTSSDLPDQIQWRIHLSSPPEKVFEALATEQGRKKAGANANTQLEELRAYAKSLEDEKTKLENEYKSKLEQSNNAYAQLQFDIAIGDAVRDSGLKFIALQPSLLTANAKMLVAQKLAEIGATPIVQNGKISLVDANGQPHHINATKTDFYKLLPDVLDPITDKTNGSGGNGGHS